jgi:ribosomal protein L34E
MLQLSYVDRAVRRMKQVLPDTKLRAKLLAKGRVVTLCARCLIRLVGLINAGAHVDR